MNGARLAYVIAASIGAWVVVLGVLLAAISVADFIARAVRRKVGR